MARGQAGQDRHLGRGRAAVATRNDDGRPQRASRRANSSERTCSAVTRRAGQVPSSRSGGGLVGLHQVARLTAQRPATSRVPGLPSFMLGPPPFSGGRNIPMTPPFAPHFLRSGEEELRHPASVRTPTPGRAGRCRRHSSPSTPATVARSASASAGVGSSNACSPYGHPLAGPDALPPDPDPEADPEAEPEPDAEPEPLAPDALPEPSQSSPMLRTSAPSSLPQAAPAVTSASESAAAVTNRLRGTFPPGVHGAGGIVSRPI